ncbi:MAG: aldo/keto reductase [Aestuariivirga sp.]|uniref:aldo/keto reductase n=1 Tax=Aestuariivirga sp. TaxID=2650926 RepID=UPI00301B0F81
MMTVNTLRQVGKSGVAVPRIGYGATALSDMPDTYGYSVGEERALATIRAIFDQPDGFIDTSRNYGLGRSEALIGKVVRELGGWPSGRILSTKLDRDMDTLRFDAAQARRSLEESLSVLRVDHVDILHLHDPEYASDLSDVTGRGGALDALMRMKEEGLARAVGLAAGRVDIMMPLLRDWDFDALITHNRYTLVNRNAEPMLELAAARGIAVFNAAPYASGALAKGAASQQRYVYQVATEDVLRPIRRVEEVCARHGIPLGAAALQFSLRDPRVLSTICGVSRPERIAETLQWANWPISDQVWSELLALPATADDPESSREYSPG